MIDVRSPKGERAIELLRASADRHPRLWRVAAGVLLAALVVGGNGWRRSVLAGELTMSRLERESDARRITAKQTADRHGRALLEERIAAVRKRAPEAWREVAGESLSRAGIRRAAVDAEAATVAGTLAMTRVRVRAPATYPKVRGWLLDLEEHGFPIAWQRLELDGAALDAELLVVTRPAP